MLISEINIISINCNKLLTPYFKGIKCNLEDRKNNPYHNEYIFFKKLPGNWYSFDPAESYCYENEFFDFEYNKESRLYYAICMPNYHKQIIEMIKFFIANSPVKSIGFFIRMEDKEKGHICFKKYEDFIKELKNKQIVFNRIYIISDN